MRRTLLLLLVLAALSAGCYIEDRNHELWACAYTADGSPVCIDTGARLP